MFEQTFKNIDDILHKDAGCTSELDYTEQSSWLLFLKYLDALEVDKALEAELIGKTYHFIIDKPYRWESWAAPKGPDGKLDHNSALTGDDGWVSTTIGDSCTLKSGTTVPVSIEKSSGDIPYVKVAEMTLPDNQDGITTSIRFLDRPDVKPGWLIPKGAVIFPKRGGAILTNKKRLALVDMCADLNIMSVIPSEKLTPEFLYFYFLTVDMRKLGTGSSIPQINNYDIAPLTISFPESRLKQAEISETIRALEKECQRLESLYQRKLTALDELKKSLLAQAFSGAL
jgi:restriction endonuclease S subunit